MIDKETAREIWKNLKKKPNVVGFSSELQCRIKGHKEVAGTKVLRVYVSKKVEPSEGKPSELKPKDFIPSTLNLGSKAFETDVVEIGILKALDNKERRRPVCAGISTMHKDGTACTINGFFKDKKTGQVLVASNFHCYALEGKAKVGDELLQPGPYDGGKVPEDVIGRLVKYVDVKFTDFNCPYRNAVIKFLRLFYPVQLFNKVDISFGSIDVPYENLATYIGQFKGKREVPVDTQVTKSGRTTEQTFGVVKDTSFVGSVQYSRGIATFEDCYLIEGNKFSQGGDSGSPVVDLDGYYIGALFAGSDTVTIVCKVKNIEEEGEVEFIPS